MRNKGFTLIEVILFIIVFSIGVIGTMVIFYNTLGKTSDPVIRERGIQIAQAVMDEILAKKWDEKIPNGGCKDDSGGVCDNYNLSSIHPDSGENNISDFDDVDDFVNTGGELEKTRTWNSEDFGLTPGFTVKITISYANVSSDDKITKNTTSKSPYKLITVEVSYSHIGESYKIMAIKADF